MQDVAGGGAADRPDDRDDVYGAVVADLVSLIERVQASLTMIESAVAAQASTALQELAANVVVLDDVTPRYLKAGAALRACNAGLGVALHFLSEPAGSEADISGSTGGDHARGSSVN